MDRRSSFSRTCCASLGPRVTKTGTVLDTTGFPIAPDGGNDPAVAFDGTNYLVVWTTSLGDEITGDIYGNRVSKAGAVLDGTGIPISTAAEARVDPAVAFDGTNYLVVWSDNRNSQSTQFAPDIYGARRQHFGTVLDSAGIPISTAANVQVAPAVAFDGTNYLVVWDNQTGTSSEPAVSKAGVVLDGTAIPISSSAGGQVDPAVAFDGTNYLVVWRDFRSGTSTDIYGARVTKAGTVLDSTGIPISTSAGSQTDPAVAFDGTNYLVAWTDNRSGSSTEIFGTRVTKAGTVLDSTGVLVRDLRRHAGAGVRRHELPRHLDRHTFG